MKFKIFLLSFLALGWSLSIRAQLSEGDIAPDFTAQDMQGQSWNLYNELNEGKPVLIHFFAAWDSFSWDYQMSGELQELYNIYGPEGTNELLVLNVESESQNDSAQLQGPQFISGNLATQTYGDWLTGNPIPVIDDSSVASLFQIDFLPQILIICPDRVISHSGEFSADILYDQATALSCPILSDGLDPAILNPVIGRVCGSTQIDISCVLKNLGSTPLSEAEIEIEGVLGPDNFIWNGMLLPFQSDTILLSGFELQNDDPVKLFLVTSNVNTTNDTVTVQAAVGLSTLTIQLELALDNYPGEISWEIRNEQDSVLLEGNDYDVSYEYINETYTLPSAGCYSFYLHDAEGDGLHGSQWGGFDGSCYLRSIDEFGNVTSVLYSNDGSYDFSPIPNTPAFERAEFEAGTSLRILESDASNGILIFPNPSFGQINLETNLSVATKLQIQIFDSAGRLVYQFISPDQISGFCRLPIDLKEFVDGLYYLQMKTDQRVEIIPISVMR